MSLSDVLVVILALTVASAATFVPITPRGVRLSRSRAAARDIVLGVELQGLRSELGLLSTEFAEWGDSIRVAAAEPSGWLEGQVLRRLVVHTTDDQSIEGLVDTVAADGVILRTARLLGKSTVALGGEVWVPRSKIVFAQAVPVEKED